MKTIFSIIVAAATLVSAGAQTTPSYTSRNASGTNSAEVIFEASPVQQARVVGAIATSDKVGSLLSWRSGTAAYSITATNLAASTNLVLAGLSGLASNDIVVIQKASGVCVSATVWGTNSATNLVLTGEAGLITVPGDEVYKMSAAATMKVGNASVNYQGEAIYVGNRGRPVRVVIDGTSACSLDSISVRYE